MLGFISGWPIVALGFNVQAELPDNEIYQLVTVTRSQSYLGPVELSTKCRLADIERCDDLGAGPTLHEQPHYLRLSG